MKHRETSLLEVWAVNLGLLVFLIASIPVGGLILSKLLR